jgi:hypothetical protein
MPTKGSLKAFVQAQQKAAKEALPLISVRWNPFKKSDPAAKAQQKAAKEAKEARAQQKAQLKQDLADAKTNVKNLYADIKKEEKLAKQETRNLRQREKEYRSAQARLDKAMKAKNTAPGNPNKELAFNLANADSLAKQQAYDAAKQSLATAKGKVSAARVQLNTAMAARQAAFQRVKQGPPPIAQPVFAANGALPQAPAPAPYGVTQALGSSLPPPLNLPQQSVLGQQTTPSNLPPPPVPIRVPANTQIVYGESGLGGLK